MEVIMNWGIIGAGVIVRKFAKGLSAVDDARVYGVAAGHRSTAETFAAYIKDNNFETQDIRVYDSAEELVRDPEIEVIYIGTPNDSHAPLCRLALENGKHVLCEKPFAMNASEAADIAGLASAKNLFIMEAMWSRFLPAIKKAKEIAQSGELGGIQYIHATFGFHNAAVDGTKRLFDPARGGGALMDVGIYPINFALNFMERFPDEIRAYASVGTTGVDETNDIEFLYHKLNRIGENQDTLCHLSSSATCDTGNEGRISFEYGEMYFPCHWAPESFILRRPKRGIIDAADRVYAVNSDGTKNERPLLTDDDFEEEEVKLPFLSNGYEYEAMEVERCIREHLTESPVHPMKQAIDTLSLMDGCRKLWGVKYSVD